MTDVDSTSQAQLEVKSESLGSVSFVESQLLPRKDKRHQELELLLSLVASGKSSLTRLVTTLGTSSFAPRSFVRCNWPDSRRLQRHPRLSHGLHSHQLKPCLLSSHYDDLRRRCQLHHVRSERIDIVSGPSADLLLYRSPVSSKNTTAFSPCSIGNICSTLSASLNTT